MKKRLWIVNIILALVLVLSFGLSACGGGNNDGDTIAVTSVTLNKSSLTLEIGDTETLTATVTPDDATNKTVTWSVSPAGVVTVENGKVTAVSSGSATVTAKAGGKSATCAVKVNSTTTQNTFKGVLSKTFESSAEEAAAAFVAEEFAGELEFVSYEKNADLTSEEISALDLGEYSASDVERGEKGTVSYTEKSATEISLFAATNEETVEIYILVIDGNYFYYTLPSEEGERVTKSYFDYVFDVERYLNCTLSGSQNDQPMLMYYTETGVYGVLGNEDNAWKIFVDIKTENSENKYFVYQSKYGEDWECDGEVSEKEVRLEFFIITALLFWAPDLRVTESGFYSVSENSDEHYYGKREYIVEVENDLVKKIEYKYYTKYQEEDWNEYGEIVWGNEWKESTSYFCYELSDFGTTQLPKLPDELLELLK